MRSLAAASAVFTATRRPLIELSVESACVEAGLVFHGAPGRARSPRAGSILVVDAEGSADSVPQFSPVPRMHVMLIGGRHASTRFRHELRQVVRGAVTTDDPLSTLALGLTHLSSGRAFASSTAAALLFESFHRDSQELVDGVSLNLSARELEVLQAMADGLSTKSIAQALRVSPKTIEAHGSRIFRRLNARTRSEAVARAISLGLLRGSGRA